MNMLTSGHRKRQDFRIDMTDDKGKLTCALYDHFVVQSEIKKFKLKSETIAKMQMSVVTDIPTENNE